MKEFIGVNRNRNPVHGDINSHGMDCIVTVVDLVGADELRRFAVELMSAIASACVVAGAKDVSHVKAFIEHATGFLHADTVGNPHDVKVEGRDGQPAGTFRLVVNTVVYGLSADAVKKITESSVSDTIGMFGFMRTSAEE